VNNHNRIGAAVRFQSSLQYVRITLLISKIESNKVNKICICKNNLQAFSLITATKTRFKLVSILLHLTASHWLGHVSRSESLAYSLRWQNKRDMRQELARGR